MIVKVKIFNGSETTDYRRALSLEIDNAHAFSVSDGEPEDNNLCRNFSDCWTIPGLLKRAYEAGRKGEELRFLEEEVNE